MDIVAGANDRKDSRKAGGKSNHFTPLYLYQSIDFLLIRHRFNVPPSSPFPSIPTLNELGRVKSPNKA